jgi:hypothetical protein
MYMIGLQNNVHEHRVQGGPSMSTSKVRDKRPGFADRVAKWSGEFEGESKQVLGEIIAAYCNGTNIEDSTSIGRKRHGRKHSRRRSDVVRNRVLAVSKASGVHGLACLAELLFVESHFHRPEHIETSQHAIEELQREHSNFTAAVRWLCSPKETNPALRPQSDAPPSESGQMEQAQLREAHRVGVSAVSYFEEHGIKHFQKHLALADGRLVVYPRSRHLTDLLCVFLLNECQDRLPEEMPIKICRKCDKLFSVAGLEGKARARKEFCSTECQRSAWWTADKRADDAFIKRLASFADNCRKRRHGFTVGDLDRRLERPKVKQRLDTIESRWKREWPQIVERMREIRTQATD